MILKRFALTRDKIRAACIEEASTSIRHRELAISEVIENNLQTPMDLLRVLRFTLPAAMESFPVIPIVQLIT